MRVNAHVPCSAAQALALPVGDVLFGLGVAVLLSHTKIDNVNDISSLGVGTTYQEVVGFDVAVDEVFLVDGLYTSDLL